MSSPSSASVSTGADAGRSARMARKTVLLPARRGTATTMNERLARATSRSVCAMSGDIVRLVTRSSRRSSVPMPGCYVDALAHGVPRCGIDHEAPHYRRLRACLAHRCERTEAAQGLDGQFLYLEGRGCS